MGYSQKSNADAKVSLIPNNINSVSIGKKITLNIYIVDSNTVFGFSSTIKFDSDSLHFLGFDMGDFFPDGSYIITPDGEDNVIKLSAKSQTEYSSGNGTLATLTFQVIQSKASEIKLSSVIFTDKNSYIMIL